MFSLWYTEYILYIRTVQYRIVELNDIPHVSSVPFSSNFCYETRYFNERISPSFGLTLRSLSISCLPLFTELTRANYIVANASLACLHTWSECHRRRVLEDCNLRPLPIWARGSVAFEVTCLASAEHLCYFMNVNIARAPLKSLCVFVSTRYAGAWWTLERSSDLLALRLCRESLWATTRQDTDTAACEPNGQRTLAEQLGASNWPPDWYNEQCGEQWNAAA